MHRNNKTKWVAAGVIITLLGIFAAIVAGWTELKQSPKDVKELKSEAAQDVKDLKVDGCDVANKNEKTIIRIEECMRHIETTQTEIKMDMRTGFEEVKKLIRERNGGG